jgi:hypothetical protein
LAQISVKKPKNKKEVVVQVYAYYHKDIDATSKTAKLMINEAIKTPKGNTRKPEQQPLSCF